MATIKKASFIRILFVAAFAAVCLLSQSETALAQIYNKTVDRPPQLSGTYAGESICVDKQPNCKKEKEVVDFEPAANSTGDILITADFAVGGNTAQLRKQRLQYNTATKFFSGQFITRNGVATAQLNLVGSVRDTPAAGATWTITVTYSVPSTTDTALPMIDCIISSTQDNTIVRRIKLKRVKPRL